MMFTMWLSMQLIAVDGIHYLDKAKSFKDPLWDTENLLLKCEEQITDDQYWAIDDLF